VVPEEYHPGVRLASVCEKLAMAKLGIDESLLAPPDLQAIVAGFQVMQHVCGLVYHDVAVRVVGLVRGPSDVRIVASQAITADVNIVWLEPIVLEQQPKDPPRRSHETRRQLRFNGHRGDSVGLKFRSRRIRPLHLDGSPSPVYFRARRFPSQVDNISSYVDAVLSNGPSRR
jgi:hypothetical protein